MLKPAVSPLVSVVIPVYRDWNQLEFCLAALQVQSLPAARIQIIVVNNDAAPLPNLECLQGVECVSAPEGYSYAARNAGWPRAKAPIVAFTDADCSPSPQWLQEGLEELERTASDLLGAQVQIFSPTDSLAAFYDTAFGLCQRYYFERWGGLATANLFVRRAALEQLQGFDARLQSGGDFEFCQRAARNGLAVTVTDRATVAHPARTSWRDIFRQNRRHTAGMMDKAWHHKPAHSRRLLVLCFHLFRPALGEWWDILRGSDLRVGTRALHQRCVLMFLRVIIYYHRAGVALAMVRRPKHGKADH